MGISFTPDQQKVIELHHRNILVSAAAGSGKTAVLVERIIRMVCDEAHPVDIDRLLIVTFTNAAAAEMRERISQGIAGQLQLHPESGHIERQATLLHNALITTIDSFCLYLIRNHFHEIGLDPAFRVADEGEIKLLKKDVLSQLLEDHFAEKDPAFINCVEFFCPCGSESVLENIIQDFYTFAMSYPWPEAWLEARITDHYVNSVEELEKSDIGACALSYLCRMLEGCVSALEQAKRLCEEPDGPYMYGELLEREIEALEKLAGCDSLHAWESAIFGIDFARLPVKKDASVSVQKREKAKELRNLVKDTIKDMQNSFFARPLEAYVRHLQESIPYIDELVGLTKEFMERLAGKKQEKKILDFNDMEHFALNILIKQEGDKLVPSPVALEYREHFAEILIDEYQDSNLVQEYLLKAVSGEENGTFNRFMVGDVKQSIYKFRLARPELFLEKYESYSSEESMCQRIDLSKNFRSRKEVVDTVNHIFSRIMSREKGGIAYDDKAALYVGASYPENAASDVGTTCPENAASDVGTTCPENAVSDVGTTCPENVASDVGTTCPENAASDVGTTCPENVVSDVGTTCPENAASDVGTTCPENVVSDLPQSRKSACKSELLLIEKPAKGDDLNAKQAEGLAIASKIKELKVNFRVTDKVSGMLRPVHYSDMVILLRTNSGWDEELKSVLQAEGIPVYITSKTGYFAAREVQELLQFLRVLDNPGQDIPLYGVMKSVFGGFTEEEIAMLRAEYKKDSPWEAEQQSEKGKDSLWEAEQQSEPRKISLWEAVQRSESRKCIAFKECIEKYRKFTIYMPIRELLQRIVEDFSYLHYVTAMPAGGKRKANIEMLFTKAEAFEKTSYFGLFHFVRYIEQLEKYDVDFGEAELVDENADLVRIMSIHKSKGLEFPVTFVAGMSKRFNMQDTSKAFLMDIDMGIATDYVNLHHRTKCKTFRKAVLSQKMKEDNLAEELRVLYVALTRAKEKLIMTATIPQAAKRLENDFGRASEGLRFMEYFNAGSYLDLVLPVLSSEVVDVKVYDSDDMYQEEMLEQLDLGVKESQLTFAGEYADKAIVQELSDRFDYRYAYDNLAALYTKTTVSELKIAAMADKDEAAYHAFEEKEVIPYIPGFRREQETVSGAVRGNAYHKVMELIDFEEIYMGNSQGKNGTDSQGKNGIDSVECNLPDSQGKNMEDYCEQNSPDLLEYNLAVFLDKQVASGALSTEYREVVNERKVLGFLTDAIAYRMWDAQKRGQLYKEQPFVFGIEASRLDKNFPESEKVLIQGIVDAFFVEEDGIVLLDYKTDRVKSGKELWNRYETQMDYYEEALCKLMNMPVKERILYSFSLGRCVSDL